MQSKDLQFGTLDSSRNFSAPPALLLRGGIAHNTERVQIQI